MVQELTVLKLGGSLLTDKTKPYHTRDDVIKSVCKEIRECMDQGLIQSLVLIQGVGSYGHPPVLERKLYKGYTGPEQLMPLSKTQSEVGEFRHKLVHELQSAGVPVCLMYPSSMIVAEKTEMTRYFFEPLEGFLSLGMPTLLGGDILIDPKMGFCVGSGDQMAVLVAKELNAKRVIFASDVAGIYSSDPKVDSSALFFPEVNLNEIDNALEQMGKSEIVDASGAMKGKLNSILPAKDQITSGMDVVILSMMEYGSLKSYLEGKNDKVTRIVVK